MVLRLEDLTTEQKIGMVMTARRFDGENLDYVKKLIRNRAVACLQIPIKEGNDKLMKELQAEADYPLMFIADMEKGYPPADLPLIPAMTLAACNNLDYVKSYAKGIVAHAKKDGYSGTWNPVVDVYPEGRGGDPGRYWGGRPEDVSKFASVVASVYAQGGFIGTGKHYPGGHDNAVDSHMVEAMSDVTEQELIDIHLKPYRDLMEQGLLPSIMSEHCVFRNIDPDYPATLSKKVMGIIRKFGFDGVIFTDSLAMMGILQKYGEDNAMAMALEAGCDVILPNYRRTCQEAYEMMIQSFKDGKFTMERLDEAVRRILVLQAFVEKHANTTVEFTEEDRQALENVAADCITAVTDEGVSAAVTDETKRRLFIVSTDMDFQEDAHEQEIMSYAWYKPDKIAEKIKEEFPDAGIIYIPEFPSASDNERVLNHVVGFDEVVFVTFCGYKAYQGASTLTRRLESVINAISMSNKLGALVHFGNPFALEPLNHISRIIFGYGSASSQPYAFEVLSGKRKAKGKLPYNVKLQ